MAGNIANSTRSQQPEFSTSRPGIRAQPHSVPSFWRLFGLHQRQTRPLSFDSGFSDDEGDYFSAHHDIARGLSLGADRVRRYDIFEEMDNFGLVQAILDVYAEEATQPDYDKGKRVWIESKANHMIQAGEECFSNCMMEDRIWAITRGMCKFGDRFQRLLYSSGRGVFGWKYAKPHQMDRTEDRFGRLVGFKEAGQKFRKALHSDGADTSFPWDYLHFRLLGKHEEDGYGTGLPEGFFREWRQLTLAEDSMLMYRLRRAPDRNLVLVDVGTLEDHEAARYTNQFRKRMRKYELIDPSTPEYKKQYNPLTPLEDVFLPIRADQNTRIETLSGSGSVGEIYDIEHMRDSFFGAARVPKAYFGFEGEINAKATLQQQDVRFARGIKRVQRATVFGIRQLLDVHYTLLRASEGGDQKFDFRQAANQYLVQMSPIAYLDEFERIELIQMRYQLVETMGNLAGAMQLDPRAWQAYVLINFAKLPEEMVMRLLQTVPPATPDGSEGKKVVGRGEGWAKLDERARTHVLYEEYMDKGRVEGFYQLSEDEKRYLGRAVHSSPGLRKSISTFAELAEEEQREAALQQTDPSLLPIIVPGGVLHDNYNDTNAAVRALTEDIAVLNDPTKLRERVLEVQHNRRASLASAAMQRTTPLVEVAP